MRSVPWLHVKPMGNGQTNSLYVPHVSTAHSIEETKTPPTRAVEKGVEVIDDLYGEALESIQDEVANAAQLSGE